GPGLLSPDQPLSDRDRHPQGRPAAPGYPESGRASVCEREHEEDRGQVGIDQRGCPAEEVIDDGRSARCLPQSTGTSSGDDCSTPTTSSLGRSGPPFTSLSRPRS